MRAIWFSGIVLCLVGTAALARPGHRMEDPLFGISYDTRGVHFETAPVSLVHRCPSLEHRYITAWVYGKLKTKDSEYFLISGLVEYRNGSGTPDIAPDEADGLAVALRGSNCLVDQADYFLSQRVNPAGDATPITVPKSVLTGILNDAFKRYTRAFGGKRQFLERVTPDAIGPHIVLEQLEAFEKQVARTCAIQVRGFSRDRARPADLRIGGPRYAGVLA